MAATTDADAERCAGELYRDENGHEVWRIKEAQTGKVLEEGIASDHDYRWLLDSLNHGSDYADEQEARRFAEADAHPAQRAPTPGIASDLADAGVGAPSAKR